jgi:AraC-like DNA-binding protein
MKDKLIEDINKAVKQIKKSGGVINYTTVSKESGIDYHTVYANCNLKIDKRAERIKAELRKSPHTVGDLAEKCNCSRGYVYTVLKDIAVTRHSGLWSLK